MTLAALLAHARPYAYAAFMRDYGINLETAEDDGYSAGYIADLASQLRLVREAINPDSAWQLPEILLAGILNSLNALIWAMGGGKGTRPELVGASWMRTSGNALKGRTMPIEELEAKLKAFDEAAQRKRLLSDALNI